MTPLEVTVKTLREHRLRMRGPVVSCSCGDFGAAVIPPHLPSAIHAQHLAGMLAAAGVVMGVQEWGVRDEHAGEVNVYAHGSEAEARQTAEEINMMTGAEAEAVTRYATAWTAEEGT